MDISDWLKVISLVIGTSGSVGGAGMYWLDKEYVPRNESHVYDDEYVTLSSQNLSLIYAAEDELAVLARKVASGLATQEDKERIATLKERIRNLRAE